MAWMSRATLTTLDRLAGQIRTRVHGRLYGLYQESEAEVLTAEAITAEDVRLVCYERLLPR